MRSINQLFEELFLAWCAPHEQKEVPDYLRGDPVRAYGQYTFEVGFKLGMQLAVNSLEPNLLAETE